MQHEINKKVWGWRKVAHFARIFRVWCQHLHRVENVFFYLFGSVRENTLTL